VRPGPQTDSIPGFSSTCRISPTRASETRECGTGEIHSGVIGSVIENVAPRSGLFAAEILPPWRSMIERQIERPIPNPSGLLVTYHIRLRLLVERLRVHGIYDQGYRRILRTVYGRRALTSLHCACPCRTLRYLIRGVRRHTGDRSCSRPMNGTNSSSRHSSPCWRPSSLSRAGFKSFAEVARPHPNSH
jgi:hypothetical protein